VIPKGAGGRGGAVPVVIIAAVVLVVVVLVALTLRRPEVPTYPPTPPVPREAGRTLTGPVLYTIDARDPEQWRRFSFQVGSAVDNAATAWDLAFKRYEIISNGGNGYGGNAGLLDLGERPFDEVITVPTSGYQLTERAPDPRNPAIARWYTYGFFSHVLTPKPHVWAVRTADGRFAKLEMVGYYCDGGQPGCVTFRYVFQGDGSPTVAVR
jgi:hypothetical protein